MRTVKVTVAGRVQGVFFRKHTQKVAHKLSLVGTVRNMPDGRVEAEVQGENGRVNEFIDWCRQGSPQSEVKEVTVMELSNDQPRAQGFRILY